MTITQIEIQLIVVVVAAACALPGVFLVLRRMAMMSDAISHTVLLGIVLGFFIFQDINSPFLVVGAAVMGVLTVSLVELLNRTGLVREDAAIGLVFPALFSLAVILISRYAANVHLDADAVLLGEVAFAPFERFEPWGVDLGPVSLYVMGAILLLNLLFIVMFYKELKLATFDPALAAALGFTPGLIHYGLMTIVSITAVGAFDTVGSILVVALMIAPPMSAYLLTDRLDGMLGLSVLFGMLGAVGGYWLAHWLDANIAGSIATMLGLIFGVVFLLAPERGLVAIARRRVQQRWIFAQAALAVHLLNHEGTPEEMEENRLDHLSQHLGWEPSFAAEVVARARDRGLVEQANGHLELTSVGRTVAQEALF
ncbi:MAG: metal ABC transporter permease [Candidatus Promineifilaceae bacterium]|nr:metal ABC transporter permease [Candidatus Promineifilaceae bacterium]